MAASSRVSVPADSPTLLATAARDGTLGGTLLIDNDSDVVVGLGGSGVTAATSCRALKARSTLGVDVAEDEALYAITPAGSPTITLDVLRVR